MIEEIKLFKYKGITELELKDLGHINVVCGKNNSGKSSILESIDQHQYRTLGRTIKESDLTWLDTNFESTANQYSSPNPAILKRWFKNFMPSQIGTTIYDNMIEEKTAEYSENFNKNAGQRCGKLNFQVFLKLFVEEQTGHFNSLLIPPKRKLEHEIIINTSVNPLPEGTQLLNRLFFLKNQDPHSKEYEIYYKIYENFSKITDCYYFNIVTAKDNKISVVFSNDPNNPKSWIKGDACGLGLRDVLVILSFVIDFDYNFIMIEEPENHIHPEMQRRLLQFLKEIEDKQFLMATHSNVFLDPAHTDKMYLVERTDTVHICDTTNKASILRDMGYSIVDNLVSDLVILTEGPSDATVIEEICKKIGFWEFHNIKIWPMGGDIMSQLDLTTFVDNMICNKVIALIDSDTESGKERERFKKNCHDMNIECVQLERYAIENYILLKTIRSFPEFKILDTVTEIKPNEKVEKQIGINLKKNLRKLTKTANIDDFADTDLFRFCKKIEEMVKQ